MISDNQVGLFSALLWYPIGSPGVLHSLFSTVCLSLERSSWGSVYPILMNDLYAGHVDAADMPKAVNEYASMARSLSMLSPEDMVWDCEDPSVRVPWSYALPVVRNSLSDCFVTDAGENLISVCGRALNRAAVENQDVYIMTLEEAVKMSGFSLVAEEDYCEC